MDLRPYGIEYTLTPQTKLPFLQYENIRYANLERNGKKGRIRACVFASGRYVVNAIMGQGTYGTTYRTRDKNNVMYAVKVIVVKPKNLLEFLKECLIQIILAEESKHTTNGPYVPILYEIGYDPERSLAFIRSELMEDTAQYVIDTNSQTENDTEIPECLMQVAEILHFFGKKLHFNHRDLKTDNIMYKTINGKREYRLIDFGFSCITWKGLKIQTISYFRASRTCFKKERDMTQLMYLIAKHHTANISETLYFRIESAILANVGKKHVCDMVVGCNELREWRNTYDFLNRVNTTVPGGTPNMVYKDMSQYLENVSNPDAPCKRGMERNSMSLRCTKKNKNNKKHAKDKEPCKEGKQRDPVTRRCKKIQVEKPCKEGKQRDPITRRCKKI